MLCLFVQSFNFHCILLGCRLSAQAERLALENERMEQRLDELRESLRKQKAEREAKGGFTWKAGHRSRVYGHASAVLTQVHAGRTTGKRESSSHQPRPPRKSHDSSGKESQRRRMPRPPGHSSSSSSMRTNKDCKDLELSIDTRHCSSLPSKSTETTNYLSSQTAIENRDKSCSRQSYYSQDNIRSWAQETTEYVSQDFIYIVFACIMCIQSWDYTFSHLVF